MYERMNECGLVLLWLLFDGGFTANNRTKIGDKIILIKIIHKLM